MITRKKMAVCFVVMGMSAALYGMEAICVRLQVVSLSSSDQKPNMTLSTIDGSITVPEPVIVASSVLKKIRDDKDERQMRELLNHKKKVEVDIAFDHQQLLGMDGISLEFSKEDIVKRDLIDIAHRLGLNTLEKKYLAVCGVEVVGD